MKVSKNISLLGRKEKGRGESGEKSGFSFSIDFFLSDKYSKRQHRKELIENRKTVRNICMSGISDVKEICGV